MSSTVGHRAQPVAFNVRNRCRVLIRRIGWIERAGLVGVILVTLIAVAASRLAPFDPILRSGPAYLPPSAAHWFGTDEVGRDLLSRVIMGIRTTWLLGLAVIFVSLIVGGTLGAVSGLAGGR